MQDSKKKDNSQNPKTVMVNVPISFTALVPITVEFDGDVKTSEDETFGFICANPEDNTELLDKVSKEMLKSKVYDLVLHKIMATNVKIKSESEDVRCFYSGFAGLIEEEEM